MKTIKKLLVANRGEIALRVMRTAKEMGIKTVAVYSEADRNALHVRYADEAILLGPPPSNQSYLLGDKIIEESLRLGVDAIHPGYGFLSENAEFSQKVRDAGLMFLGPKPYAIDTMGDKLKAKQAVKNYDVPLVPGTDEAITDVPAAQKLAEEIGYPVLIKAAAGGGGKGMRIVRGSDEFVEQMNLAVSEATSAFGNGSVFIEKYVDSPRHIEIQVLADQHGNVVHLFERECSVQRRHQKVVEEAPSSILTPETRDAMGLAAVNVAKACDYEGAGTVEFIYDASGSFYFLEMNTRLQVEHPVTELITGVDLVREQIRIAEGRELSFAQEDLTIHGHAVEVRVYAEDPSENFMPDIGNLKLYQRPQGPGIRVDDGLEQGMDVPIYYDPMIAKLIVHAGNREMAMDRMIRAIDEYRIGGVKTTLPFCRFTMEHEAFRSGDFDTHFVQKHYEPSMLNRIDDEGAEVAALMGAWILSTQSAKAVESTSSSAGSNAWRRNRTL
ncbi:acetyl-CoA carboxylase biotin carboxylase subunit [Phaeocystidibacter marisrubri]|uniref:Acetyl-CoA carboxylase biotin carboxylase subunit n=1 Tax=Phaeocystidibacter marisrubri TaxID=1577780 RepID=A0A6L3ZK71_9FLAO|nr:acetyl-CoA carboxylase biotin carboxylase subunit [Phaeocystidibacter marisrubri]GGH72672.1 acetyl-CoA carboxylase biotin carboxylase subunit [Phaeocystidibacter marisrubri]